MCQLRAKDVHGIQVRGPFLETVVIWVKRMMGGSREKLIKRKFMALNQYIERGIWKENKKEAYVR